MSEVGRSEPRQSDQHGEVEVLLMLGQSERIVKALHSLPFQSSFGVQQRRKAVTLRMGYCAIVLLHKPISSDDDAITKQVKENVCWVGIGRVSVSSNI
jgi:hypothetical protein